MSSNLTISKAFNHYNLAPEKIKVAKEVTLVFLALGVLAALGASISGPLAGIGSAEFILSGGAIAVFTCMSGGGLLYIGNQMYKRKKAAPIIGLHTFKEMNESRHKLSPSY